MIQFLWLIPLGFFVGTFGTLIGAGGGFILVPILLLLYPDKSPATITSISLAVVFFNSLSGSCAYTRMKRVDFKSGIVFAIATIPGSILGSITTSYMPRQLFNGIFGVLLILLSIFLFIKPENKKQQSEFIIKKHYWARTITDREGTVHTFAFNPIIGIVLSVFVGFFSSLLGIGGGIIHVPALVQLLNYPVHIATATSHFILVFMSFTGSIVHLMDGTLQAGILITLALAVGVIFGAQLGAKLSKFLKGNLIIRCLAGALCLVGFRILIMAF